MNLPGWFTSHLACCLLVFGVIIKSVTGNGDWSYEPPTDPSTWANIWPNCGGKMQSPINLLTKDAKYDGSLRDLDIQYRNETAVKLFNRHGHAIQANVLSDGFSITGVDLGFRFRLSQFHFHWGSGNTQGSEHQINGGKFPMEMHLVHYNAEKYPNASTAQQNPDGLAVISVLFELKSAANPGLNKITDYLKNVSYQDESINLQSVSVNDLLPSDTTSFYRYNGSLTTPGCYETVKWIILKNKATVSQAQLEKFRSVYATIKQDTKKRKLENNFRPVQALNNRIVRKNFDEFPFPCGKQSNLTAACRRMVDGKDVFYEVEVHACTLPVSVTFKVNIPGLFYSNTTVSEDIKTPIQIGSFDQGASMEMHYHTDGENAGKIHVTVYQGPLSSSADSSKVKVMDEYFTIAGVCQPAKCKVDSWDKHWCTATIGYQNDTLDLGFSSILFEQCSPSSPHVRVKIYRQEDHWVWAAQRTFKNNDKEDIGLTGIIVHHMSTRKRRNAANTRWSPVTFEASIHHGAGTDIDFMLFMIKKDIGGRYLVLKDRYTYPKNACTVLGSTSHKVAIGVSVGVVLFVMISVAVWLLYRKRKQFFGHRSTLIDEIDIHDADTL